MCLSGLKSKQVPFQLALKNQDLSRATHRSQEGLLAGSWVASAGYKQAKESRPAENGPAFLKREEENYISLPYLF